MKKCLTKSIIILSASILVSSCATSNYEISDNLAELNVTFVDSKWDGKTVPKDEVCKRGGANGSSPQLKINNIPTGSNAVVVEFNDRNYAPLSTNGGHGAIWIAVENSNSSTIPSVKTESDELPAGVNVEHKHRGSGSGIGRGVYLAPCSNGRGNLYFADVKAVHKSESSTEKLLGVGKIILGRY